MSSMDHGPEFTVPTIYNEQIEILPAITDNVLAMQLITMLRSSAGERVVQAFRDVNQSLLPTLNEGIPFLLADLQRVLTNPKIQAILFEELVKTPHANDLLIELITTATRRRQENK